MHIIRKVLLELLDRKVHVSCLVLWLLVHLPKWRRIRISSRRFGLPTTTAHVGGKSAVISDYRVILYREPVMLVVACPLGAC